MEDPAKLEQTASASVERSAASGRDAAPPFTPKIMTQDLLLGGLGVAGLWAALVGRMVELPLLAIAGLSVGGLTAAIKLSQTISTQRSIHKSMATNPRS